jgi:hypothetical protein
MNSEGSNYKELNIQTVEDLRLHKLDLKIAEKQVFGRQLNQNDWEILNDEEKKLRSARILEIVKQRMQKRHKESGRF